MIWNNLKGFKSTKTKSNLMVQLLPFKLNGKNIRNTIVFFKSFTIDKNETLKIIKTLKNITFS
jgi:hypothetical protein